MLVYIKGMCDRTLAVENTRVYRFFSEIGHGMQKISSHIIGVKTWLKTYQ